MVRVYCFLEVAIGSTKEVCQKLNGIEHPTAKIVTLDTVTGPYDIILMFECNNSIQARDFIAHYVQRVNGVQRTSTSFAVKLV